MNTKLKQRRKFVKLASGLMVTPFASLTGGAASAQDGTAPLRLLTIIEPYGLPNDEFRRDIWINNTAGDYPLEADQLGTTLAPLSAYTDQMLVCTGNDNISLRATGSSPTHHHFATNTLTGSSSINGGSGEASATTEHASIDFHIGHYLNGQNGLNLGRAFPHLFFSNYAESDATTFCYDASGNQIRSLAGPINQARSVFANGVDNASGIQLQNEAQKRIFDLVQTQVQSLRGQLNEASASTVIDAYESSVDDLAAQIEILSEGATAQCRVPENVDNFPDVGRSSLASTPFIFRNIQQAFACDLTSSLTYAIGGEKINQLNHGELYDEDEHRDDAVRNLLDRNQHSMSHQTSAAADRAHEIVRIHQTEELATLLDGLSSTQDVDRNSLLDNTVVFFTSAMGTNTHSANDYCQLIIAGRNTRLRGGFHYDLTGHSHNELLVTIAQGLGLPDDRYGGHNRQGVYVSVNDLPQGPISRMLSS